MSIIVGTNVSKSFGAFDLFTDLNFSVARGDKIALVGANGCGKTTLLTIVAGVQDANMGGGVSMARGTSRGYLSQTAEESNEHTVWQEMQTAFVQINELAHKLALLEHEMADLWRTATRLRIKRRLRD
jgi:ATP-binding cassette, subfamily F, member 3